MWSLRRRLQKCSNQLTDEIMEWTPRKCLVGWKKNLFILFINYNTITNYILIIYELNNFDHVFGVVSQTRVSGGNRGKELLIITFFNPRTNNRFCWRQMTNLKQVIELKWSKLIRIIIVDDTAEIHQPWMGNFNWSCTSHHTYVHSVQYKQVGRPFITL